MTFQNCYLKDCNKIRLYSHIRSLFFAESLFKIYMPSEICWLFNRTVPYKIFFEESDWDELIK